MVESPGHDMGSLAQILRMFRLPDDKGSDFPPFFYRVCSNGHFR